MSDLVLRAGDACHLPRDAEAAASDFQQVQGGPLARSPQEHTLVLAEGERRMSGGVMPEGLAAALIGLQAVQVAILWPHDLLPLGSLNYTKAVRRAGSLGRLVRVTLVQSVPYEIGLVGSVLDCARPCSGWLMPWLWVSYGLLFVGELRAWWWPYLIRCEPDRAARYQAVFGRTHGFPPESKGIAPNGAVSPSATCLR